MFDYLLDYGIKNKVRDYQDIDITDKLVLEKQINDVRYDYNNMLHLLDEINSKYLDCSKRISKLTKEKLEEDTTMRINQLLSMDEEYLALEAERDALSTGIDMVKFQINFIKEDLKILNSTFYNKF